MIVARSREGSVERNEAESSFLCSEYTRAMGLI